MDLVSGYVPEGAVDRMNKPRKMRTYGGPCPDLLIRTYEPNGVHVYFAPIQRELIGEDDEYMYFREYDYVIRDHGLLFCGYVTRPHLISHWLK